MRVIAGSAKGRKLKSSLRYAIRPTSDKVKGALFDILGPQIQGVGFLDLFAGTGNIGIEALSRGAKHTTFVEKKYCFIELIRHNLQACGFSDCEIIHYDVLKTIPSLHNRQRKFGIIFIDPPYHSDLAVNTLEALAVTDIFDKKHIIIVEHGHKNPLPERIGDLYSQRVVKFGDTLLSFYQREKEL